MQSLIDSLQSLYSHLGFVRVATVVDLVIPALVLLTGVTYLLLPKNKKTVAPELAPPESLTTAPSPEVKKVEVIEWHTRLTRGLAKTRNEVWNKVENIFSRGQLDEQAMEEMEELLYTADLGPVLVEELLNVMKKNTNTQSDHRKIIFDFLQAQFASVQAQAADELFNKSTNSSKRPYVIMIVGVNGAGKTTTIGKLATRLTRQGAKVVVGACDTFRAAAVDQLQVWCERAGAQMVRAKDNSAPSGVGYQALDLAIREQADYCLLDTAGRLHTKEDLMVELEKSKKVLAKLMPDAPHQVLLVLDAIAGQNSLRQAQEFHKALGLTGLIFTKCDGSSKAGSAVGIVRQLKVPITYIGVGEGVEDLDRFVADDYLAALLNMSN
jgi:fused signal recognition particle receptor